MVIWVQSPEALTFTVVECQRGSLPTLASC